SVMLHLLRYRELAVVHYSGVPCALHLQHAQQSLNLGLISMVTEITNAVSAQRSCFNCSKYVKSIN
ncbi:MAG: hypothetical protein OQK67_02395, partial [Chlorobium sp.]|nr:hypothetical protein [Chlorobium sp.]MCW8816004.1 hypothetical protein [Chlorobium sp.]MCW8819517.1 hypothetical protein [Ignavibacteriaceae bacterium]